MHPPTAKSTEPFHVQAAMTAIKLATCKVPAPPAREERWLYVAVAWFFYRVDLIQGQNKQFTDGAIKRCAKRNRPAEMEKGKTSTSVTSTVTGRPVKHCKKKKHYEPNEESNLNQKHLGRGLAKTIGAFPKPFRLGYLVFTQKEF